MSLTQSTDPVQAVVDILQWAKRSTPSDLFLAGFGASQAGFGSDLPGLSSETTTYYSNGNPKRIKRDTNVEPSDKNQNQRLSQVSLYVGQAIDATNRKHSAKGDLESTAVPTIEIWTNDEASTDQYRRDLQALFAQFETDNSIATPFLDIFPDGDVVDDRAQGFYYGGFEVETVGVRLEEYRDL